MKKQSRYVQLSAVCVHTPKRMVNESMKASLPHSNFLLIYSIGIFTFLANTSAPALRRARTHSACPFHAAECKGVWEYR